jgi:superfamily I DNA/RNA helicase
MRLLHSLVGDAANGLLVIGDGQQAVYPGGYRLSEAGITIAGARGVVLRTNYRNAEAIWDAAMTVVASDTFEDVDETRSVGRRDVETTYRDGAVVRVDAADQADHDQRLLDALRALMTGSEDTSGDGDTAGSVLADAAVLCARNKDVEHYLRLLTKAGIPTQRLEHYDGHQGAGCKIGTFHRVKGLEFKHVFLPRHDALFRDTNGFSSAAPERAELIRRQLFVAMTRARDSLWLGSVQAHADARSTAS